ASGAIERAVVRMRALLLRPVGARRAGERRQIAPRAERPVLIDREKCDGARRIIGDDEEAPGCVDGEVHAVPAAGRLLIEYAQPAGCLIDPVRRGLRSVAVNRIEAALLAIDDDEGRIGKLLQQLDPLPSILLAGPVEAD